MYKNWKAHDFYFLFVVCCVFFIRSLWHWGLHTPYRRTYLRKTDFYTQRVAEKRDSPISEQSIFKSLPSSGCPLAWSDRWRTEQTGGADRVHMGWRSRAINTAPVQNQPFRPEGKRLREPFGLKPAIILYRNRTINIYIIMIDYIYVQLHIDIYTASKVYCPKGVILPIYQL